LAGILTLLLAWVWPALEARQFEGGGVLTTALWLALGLEIGKRQLNFFGFGLTGHLFAALGLAFVLLEAIFNTPAAVVPSLAGVFLCFLWLRSGGLWERYGSWRMGRKFALRRKRMNILVGGKRNTPTDSDPYVH